MPLSGAKASALARIFQGKDEQMKNLWRIVTELWCWPMWYITHRRDRKEKPTKGQKRDE